MRYYNLKRPIRQGLVWLKSTKKKYSQPFLVEMSRFPTLVLHVCSTLEMISDGKNNFLVVVTNHFFFFFLSQDFFFLQQEIIFSL